METQELIKTETTKQKIELVKGEFTPSEASHVINSLINEKINFHKLQRLQVLEGDHGCQTNSLDGRISELEKEKEIARNFINEIRVLGQNLKISGTLTISLID
ncbi:hypothetical protein ACWGOQ_0015930 [Aquimarina sp. M1]